MSKNFNPYSNYGYVALKKETTYLTPVQPDTYVKIKNESFKANYGLQSINEIATDRERNRRAIQSFIEMEGGVEVFVDEKVFPHFINSFMGAASIDDTPDTGIERKRFALQNEGVSYTYDIQVADAPWVHRYYGAYVKNITFSKDDNALSASVEILPTKAFLLAKLTAAASSGTTLTVDQTEGLTTSDTLLVLQRENGYTTIATYTISSIDNSAHTITTNETISDTLDIDDIVVIKRATVTEENFSQCTPFQFANGLAIYHGDDIDNTSEFTKEDFEINLTNEIESKFGSGITESSRFPETLIPTGYEASCKVSRFYDSQYNLTRLRSNTKLATRYLFQGRTALAANSAQKASSTWGTTNGFKIEASTAGKAGNDINVTIVVAADDNLAASISGNNILISLANTTASKNTGTLIAAAVDALSGVDGTAEGTGAEEFTTAESNINLGSRGSGTDVFGLDASQKPYIQIDFADCRMAPYAPNNNENEIAMEDIEMTVYKDTDCDNDQRKNWSTMITVVNDVTAY